MLNCSITKKELFSYIAKYEPKLKLLNHTLISIEESYKPKEVCYTVHYMNIITNQVSYQTIYVSAVSIAREGSKAIFRALDELMLSILNKL